jgi:hypothetical protein
MVEIDWRFRGAHCLHHQGDNLTLCSKGGNQRSEEYISPVNPEDGLWQSGIIITPLCYGTERKLEVKCTETYLWRCYTQRNGSVTRVKALERRARRSTVRHLSPLPEESDQRTRICCCASPLRSLAEQLEDRSLSPSSGAPKDPFPEAKLLKRGVLPFKSI